MHAGPSHRTCTRTAPVARCDGRQRGPVASLRPSTPLLLPPARCRFVFRIGMPPRVRIELVSKLGAIEHRLAYGTSERLQLGALCGAFAEAKEGIVAAAQ